MRLHVTSKFIQHQILFALELILLVKITSWQFFLFVIFGQLVDDVNPELKMQQMF